MARVIFFGVDGAFSRVTLAALVDAGLRPNLVIHGRERGSGIPVLRRWPVSPSPVARFVARTEALVGRGLSPEASDLTQAAHGFGIDVWSTTQAHHPTLLEAMAETRPEVLVIAGFSHLLKPSVLALAERGGLNLHPGHLPAERGPAPVYWALKAGRTQFGWTVHRLDPGEDSGEVVTVGELSVEPGTTGQAIHERLAEAGAPALVAATRALLSDTLVSTPQATIGVGRCPRPTLADRRLDQGQSAKAVYTFVAGCSPSHRLWAEVAGDRFFVAQAIGYDPEARLDYDFVLLGDRLLLACQPGVVELELTRDGAIFSAEYSE
ncbi:MAG: hypothetical protein IPG45_19550 [Deltaproteobacteria bacterium]|jgi:methionyl-tRNA formyltransferase|nr:hypothetical protein [Deltaproteobacteria bacterium]